MQTAMTSLSIATATLIAWSCGQASSTDHTSPSELDTIDSNMVEFDWGLLPEEDTLELVTGWYYVVEPGQGIKRILDGDTSTYWLNSQPIVTAKHITTFELYKSNFDKSWGLTMKLNETGADLWREATGHAIGGRLAFVVRNKLIYTPQVMAEIPSGMTALNRGTYSKGELKAIMKAIQAEQ